MKEFSLGNMQDFHICECQLKKSDMKYISVFVLFTIFTVTSCTKSHEENVGIINKSITGAWNYTQRFYSLGGPLVYESTTQLRQRITFDKVGKLSSDIPAYKNFESISLSIPLG